MAIYKGSTEIEELFKGSTEIQGVFKGSTEVWSNLKVIDLGTGKSFNVANVYSKYADLTNDNFYVVSASSTSIYTGVGLSGQGSWADAGSYTSIYKSYNASTGVLTCNLTLIAGDVSNTHQTQTANVRVYLVTKPDKLHHLGSGQTFDVASALPSLYQSLTADDFMFKSANSSGYYNRYWGEQVAYSVWFTGTGILDKSYNATTGQLTLRTRNIIEVTSGSDYISGTRYGNCDVYINFKEVIV